MDKANRAWIGVLVSMVAFAMLYESGKEKRPYYSGVSAERYSLSDVKKHDTAKNCWTAIEGGVYDLSSWIAAHPGGTDAILALCGRDGTESFLAQHKGQENPERKLEEFLVGDFIK